MEALGCPLRCGEPQASGAGVAFLVRSDGSGKVGRSDLGYLGTVRSRHDRHVERLVPALANEPVWAHGDRYLSRRRRDERVLLDDQRIERVARIDDVREDRGIDAGLLSISKRAVRRGGVVACLCRGIRAAALGFIRVSIVDSEHRRT
jgi:hypothetical protein